LTHDVGRVALDRGTLVSRPVLSGRGADGGQV
jgi:hypothetical protein